ncbi:MAG: hypothetical protein U9N35_06570 [Euryarchaeota archaeon]|nr:hypothetical protein [Euryarchaeota archaeon]
MIFLRLNAFMVLPYMPSSLRFINVVVGGEEQLNRGIRNDTKGTADGF